MVVYVYSCLLTGIIQVQIHTGIITWNGTGIFMFLEFQESRGGGGGIESCLDRGLDLCSRVVVFFFDPFSIVITSLGKERTGLCASRAFVC